LQFIFYSILNRIRCLIVNNFKIQYNNNNNISNLLSENLFSWFVNPYIVLIFILIFNKFKGVTKDLYTKLSFYNVNKLQGFIKTHKDPFLNLLKKNIVYKLACTDHDAIYVGQICRQLKTKIFEHKNHIREIHLFIW